MKIFGYEITIRKAGPAYTQNTNFARVCNSLKHNRIMVDGSRSDGVYIRFAGREYDNEFFSLDWIKVCDHKTNEYKALEEEVRKRYGSFELSHDKNENIVRNIMNFMTENELLSDFWNQKLNNNG